MSETRLRWGRRVGLVLVFVAALAIPQLITSQAQQYVALLVLINASAALGLTLLFGFAGQISLTQAAFMGIGSYAPAILALKLNLNPWLGLPIGVGAAMAIAYLIGRPVLRLEGVYLAMASAAFNIIFIVVIQQSSKITGGTFGLLAVPPLQILGIQLYDPKLLYYFVLVALALMLVMAHRLIRSPLGLMFLAVGHDSRAAGLAGIPVASLKARTFVLSAAFAAVGGFFFTAAQGVATPDTFALLPSVYILVMVVVGGMRSLVGPIVGAAFVSIVPQLIPKSPRAQEILFAVLFLAVIMFLPDGLAARATWSPLLQLVRLRSWGPLGGVRGSA